jgi:peptide chain release factor subunit 1
VERPGVDVIRALAAFRTEGTAVSCYLGLDPSEVPNARVLGSHVTSLVDRARRAGATAEDAEHVERTLTTELDRNGLLGLALFVGDGGAVSRLVGLADPVDETVYVGRAFVLTPLLEELERRRDVVLAAVGRDRGSVWLVRDGRAGELEELSRDGQSQHDQGGWSQARYARARDKEALDHMREVATAVADAIPAGSERLLAIACLQEQRSAFEELLAAPARAALAGWIDFEAHADVADLLPTVARLVDEHLARGQNALLEQWREERGQGSGRATWTWEETLAAAADGSVDALLLLDGDAEAFECPRCGRGYVEAGACVLDGSALEPAAGGARGLAARATILHGGTVHTVAADVGGAEVGALLRYPRPERAG